MKKTVFVILMLAVVLVACGGGFPPEFPAADFSLKSPMTNTTESLAELKGKPFILYWFTSW